MQPARLSLGRPSAPLSLAVAIAIAGSGCGASSGPSGASSGPSGASSGPSGGNSVGAGDLVVQYGGGPVPRGAASSATFVINGETTSVSVGPRATVTDSFESHPRLNYSGPQGCTGRYFTNGGGRGHTQLIFHYSSRDAYVIDNDQLYHFITGPRRQAGKLVWDHTFGANQVQVAVDCPPPPPSGPLLPLSY